MTVPIPTRFTEHEVVRIDDLVAEGVGENRSDVIRRAVQLLDDAVQRRRTGETIAESYRTLPQTEQDDALAMTNANAMTEAEPW